MSLPQDSTIGAFDAGANFSDLMARVAQGQTFTITQQGVPVARLVPVEAAPLPVDRREVIDAMRKLAQGNHLDGLSIKDLIAEGRR